MFTFVGLGESLLDKRLEAKVHFLKENGFNGIGLVTNGSLLTPTRAERLIVAGLDTIIISIDGLTKATHESIRLGTNFDEIVENATNFINLRNRLSATKIIVRMIRHDKNRHECADYFEYWNQRLNSEFGDMVAFFDVYSHEETEDKKRIEAELAELSRSTKMICSDLTDRMLISLRGDVALCCAADVEVHKMGNIFEDDPLKIYNNEYFTSCRKKMADGLLESLDWCKNCELFLNRLKSEYIKV